jgi:hypothetical protein
MRHVIRGTYADLAGASRSLRELADKLAGKTELDNVVPLPSRSGASSHAPVVQLPPRVVHKS